MISTDQPSAPKIAIKSPRTKSGKLPLATELLEGALRKPVVPRATRCSTVRTSRSLGHPPAQTSEDVRALFDAITPTACISINGGSHDLACKQIGFGNRTLFEALERTCQPDRAVL